MELTEAESGTVSATNRGERMGRVKEPRDMSQRVPTFTYKMSKFQRSSVYLKFAQKIAQNYPHHSHSDTERDNHKVMDGLNSWHMVIT